MTSKEILPRVENDDVTEKISKLNINEVSYSVPEFSCHQNQDELVFVIKVKYLESGNIKIVYDDGDLKSASSRCRITYSPKGEKKHDKTSIHYSLYLKFLPECLVLPGKEMVTASEMNAVIILKKDEEARHYWEYFYYGVDAERATFQELMTVSALQHKLDILHNDANRIIDSNQNVPDSEVKVSFVDDDRVDIFFEDAKISASDTEVPETTNCENLVDNRDSSNDASNKTVNCSALNGSGTIELQFIDQPPACSNRGPGFRRFRSISESSGTITVKGILKHRRRRSETFSESSDELSFSSQEFPGVDFDIPEEESTNNSQQPKKSVHFNDNVFRSFFRSNSSILGQREKNRRKQKKKQEILRRRRSSDGDSSGVEAADEPVKDYKKNDTFTKLDINQNQSNADDVCETTTEAEWQDLLHPVTIDNRDGSIKNGPKPKKENRRKRKKKGGLTLSSNDGELQLDNDETFNVPMSSASSQYQRYHRYFSRKRHTSY